VTAGNARRVRTLGRVGQSGRERRRAELESALGRLREALEGYSAPLTDRAVAERELAGLEAVARTARPDEAALRQGLLLLASAVGSVRVLAPALAELRSAVDRFSLARQRAAAGDY
jgi:hypothetical protein